MYLSFLSDWALKMDDEYPAKQCQHWFLPQVFHAVKTSQELQINNTEAFLTFIAATIGVHKNKVYSIRGVVNFFSLTKLGILSNQGGAGVRPNPKFLSKLVNTGFFPKSLML